MIANRKKLLSGVSMMVIFIIVLVIMFLPVFDGKNGMEYLDALYNSISKGSAYYIPDAKMEAVTFIENPISVTLTMKNKAQADQTSILFKKGGADVKTSENEITVNGMLGKILENCLMDADDMYHNKGEVITDKYNCDERLVLFNWWSALKKMDSALSKQEKFKEAKIVTLVLEKAVETSYNYYKIAPQKITDSIIVVVFSLVFYVAYTLWYGFSIMYMFEGLGMNLEH